MDGLFKLLWPLSHISGPTVDIPTYQPGEAEDQVDLQIKSLLYMFRRCNIASSEQFRPDDESPSVGGGGGGLRDKRSVADLRVLTQTNQNALNKYSNDGLHGMSSMDKQKLDVMYSKSQFERVLSNNEHRVLIDWTKNKFRSLCILSGHPQEMDTLPSFQCPNFHFIVLPADSSEDDYIRILSCSDLYIEHAFSLAQRQKLVKEILYSLRSRSKRSLQGENEGSPAFSKDDRSFIIHKYLTMLATEIQVERLYRATIRAKQQQLQKQQQQQQQLNRQENQSPLHTLNEKVSSPPRKLHTPSSPDRSRSRSPERLSNGSNGRTNKSPERVSNGNKIYIHGNNPTSSHPKLSSYPSLPSLSSVTTRSPTRSFARSPSPARSPTSTATTTSPSASPTPRLRSKVSNLALRKPPPDLNPLALTKTEISPAIQRETMEQARFAVRSRIEREKSLLLKI